MSEAMKLDASDFLARCLAESRTVHCITAAADGAVRDCNAAMAAALGVAPAALVGRPLWERLTQPDAASLRQRVQGGPVEPSAKFLLNFVDANQAPFTLECRCAAQADGFLLLGELPDDRGFQEEWLRMNNQLAVLARENARRGKELASIKTRLEQTLHDLETSYWHLEKIQDVLPICMGCGQVKAGAQWQGVIDYLKEHALFLSHGYCPACLARLAGEYGIAGGGAP